MEAIKQKLYERVAQLYALEVPLSQIAIATGLTVENVGEIVAMPEVRQQASAFASDQMERFHTLNDGWDTLEELAVGRMLIHMNASPDPEFAAKVAQMANRAERRGVRHNRTIEGQVGVPAVVHLNQTFVTKMEAAGNAVNMQPQERAIEQKKTDVMNPQQVENLLTKGTKAAVQADINRLFGNLNAIDEAELQPA